MTFRFSASDPDATDIGPVYDIGLSTRDGSTLSCLDRNFKPVLTDRIAYMVSRDPQHTMKESTELQEKQRLIQLGTSTSIDREFDQWVQNTQGDWSAGAGQRVYGNQGINNQYFDGEGLLWPINDYVPQKALPGPIIPKPGGAVGAPVSGGEIVGGYVAGAGNGYCWFYSTFSAGNQRLNAIFQAGDTQFVSQFIFSGPNVLSAIAGAVIAHGFIWVLTYAVAGAGYNTVQLFQLGIVAGVLTVISDTNVVTNQAQTPTPKAIVEGGVVGGKAYIAIALSYTTTAPATVNEVIIYDISAGGNPLTVSTTITFPIQTSFVFSDMNFQGANLYVVVSDGFTATIVNSTPPWSTASTVAILPGLGTAFLTSIGGLLFIVGSSSAGANVNRMDLFTLSGTTLTEIGSVITPVPILQAVSSPTTFGGYAIWTVTYLLPGAASSTVTVYAYDAVRARLFRALSFTDPAFVASANLGHNGVAVFGTTSRTLNAGATIQAQWGIALPTEALSNQNEMAREFYWGVLPLTPVPPVNGVLQMGVSIISGIIDFTAATNKLFRQVVAAFDGGMVLGSALNGVTLNAWLDQDPASLNPVPDFTVTTAAPPTSGPAPTKIALVVNKMARKLVYQVISFSVPFLPGGPGVSAAWQPAPKIKEVVTQIATGWVWDLVLDLAPGARTNTGAPQEYAYTRQTTTDAAANAIDQVVAYNFLRQLWRLKGGECTIYLPNGDTFSALLQLEEFESPKPLAVSSRSDQPTQYQEWVTVKIREDI